MKMPGHDTVLAARISEYLQSAGDGPIDVFRMAKDLQGQYKEYTRRKRVVFLSNVRAAYNAIIGNAEADEEHVNGKDRGRKRKRKGAQSRDSSEEVAIVSHSSDEGEGSADLVVYQDTNMMNSSLTNLYRTKAAPGTHSAAGTPKGGFYVDRTPALEGKQARGEGDQKRSKNRTSAKRNRIEERTKDDTMLETSTVTLADFGGSCSEIVDLCKLLCRMKHPELYQTLGHQPPRGFLLHGPPGCGKTLLAYAVAGELNTPFIKLAATELVSGVSGESEQKIRDLFDQALAHAPCIVFLDEIDAITPRRETAQREMERRIVAQLASCLDDVRNSGKHVILIGATHRPDSLDPGLRRAGRFDKEIALGIPNEVSRAEILKILCRNIRLDPNFQDYHRLARLCPGYVGADLSALVSEATALAIDRIFEELCSKAGIETGVTTNLERLQATKERLLKWIREGVPFGEQDLKDVYVTMKDFEIALKKVSPSAMREGFATVPDVTWQDVGALADLKEELKWAILYPIQHPEEFESSLVSKSQGILLCGPPGCGKTLLAKAVSNETAMNFISVKGPELMNMYVGESERAIREVFQRASNSAPCVIFFDEFDALCPRRPSFDTGSSIKVVHQLLTVMDGLDSRRQVFIIGATNRPDSIDPAVLRPGRLDKIIYVGFPNATDRADILRALTRNDTQNLGADVDLDAIAQDPRVDFFTGADLAALVREAYVKALKERMRAEETGIRLSSTVVIAKKHFELAFERVKPSVQPKERERYLALQKKYGVAAGSESASNR